MTKNITRWHLDGHYPAQASFPALLTWHLEWNGTRPSGNLDSRGIAWTYAEFAAVVDEGFRAQPESKDKKVGRWCSGENKPDQPAIKRIEQALFGENPVFDAWRDDLRRAWSAYAPPRRVSANAAPAHSNIHARDEVSTAATEDRPDQTNAVNRELGLRRDLLEVVAMRFGHDAPDAPDEVLLGFIKEKGREYKQFKAELADIAEPEEQLKAAHLRHDELMAEGRIAEADALLGEAEDYFNYTKIALNVAVQAETRRKRALTALEQGNIPKLFEHFQTIARLYGAIHPHMEEIHRVMFAYGLVTLDPPPGEQGQELAIEMIRPIIEDYRLCYSYGMGADIGFGETRINRLFLLPFLMIAPKVAAFVTDER